ncbi:hypothetical protein [Sciscionella marina]|nr:hypothetical protein [Sciscionella marina]
MRRIRKTVLAVLGTGLLLAACTNVGAISGGSQGNGLKVGVFQDVTS